MLMLSFFFQSQSNETNLTSLNCAASPPSRSRLRTQQPHGHRSPTANSRLSLPPRGLFLGQPSFASSQLPRPVSGCPPQSPGANHLKGRAGGCHYPPPPCGQPPPPIHCPAVFHGLPNWHRISLEFFVQPGQSIPGSWQPPGRSRLTSRRGLARARAHRPQGTLPCLILATLSVSVLLSTSEGRVGGRKCEFILWGGVLEIINYF